MQYSTVLIFSILTAGLLGGTASYFGAGGDAESVGAAIHDAKATVRDTMRELDSSYYKRGEAYAACADAYGSRMAGKKANGEITLSCECFDKSMRMLGGLDRETALKGLGPGTDAGKAASGGRFKITATAGRVLRRCDIEPWTGGPDLPAAKPARDVMANAAPSDETEPSPMSGGGLRGSF